MASVHDVVGWYGAAWNAAEDERRTLLDSSWADDGVYCDPGARAEGREALIKHIGGFQAGFPNHRIDLTSGVDEHDGRFRFSWVLRSSDGRTVTEGIDFGVLSDDGRIASITGFFGPLPSA